MTKQLVSKTKTTIPNRGGPRIKRLVIVAICALVLVAFVWAIIALYKKSSVNYAEEVTKPLETALVANGASKKCSYGDNGRGSDNSNPWLNTYYELPIDREQAISVINKIAIDNGYSLSHASLTNRGPVPVADPYIGNWFYDTVGKPSPYNDLQTGKIELFFTVNNDGPMSLACGAGAETVTITGNQSTSIVGIRISLPDFRR